MPAKNLHRSSDEGIYSHIYNKGIEKRNLFNDDEDYAVFQSFLKDYLTVPQNPESLKKIFKVHGRTFRGTPHQPKNYFNKVELLAYSLMPDHFHLLLHQMTRGSLESFIRSLCTRYSIYFNKKYQHTGTLFDGPYKSAQIKDKPHLMHLTRYLHLRPKEHHTKLTEDYSSYAEYLGIRETLWVKPKAVLSFFGKGMSDYKNFVEKYELDQEEKEFIKDFTFESDTQHLERRVPAINVKYYPPETPTEPYANTKLTPNLNPMQRLPEFLAATVIFLLLLAIGITNIMISTTKTINISQTQSVLSETTNSEKTSTTPANAVKPIKIVRIEINNSTESININEKPTTNSKKIGNAKDGDTFEFVSLDSEWYGVKLIDGSTGFIPATYIKE